MLEYFCSNHSNLLVIGVVVVLKRFKSLYKNDSKMERRDVIKMLLLSFDQEIEVIIENFP